MAEVTSDSGAEISRKSRLAAALLAWFLGELGVHRFYLRDYLWGAVMLVLSVAGLLLSVIATANSSGSWIVWPVSSSLLSPFISWASTPLNYFATAFDDFGDFKVQASVGAGLLAAVSLWKIVDFVRIAAGLAGDESGRPLRKW